MIENYICGKKTQKQIQIRPTAQNKAHWENTHEIFILVVLDWLLYLYSILVGLSGL